jgi:hypothetical protein
MTLRRLPLTPALSRVRGVSVWIVGGNLERMAARLLLAGTADSGQF